jgi:hypothetical protein
LARLDLQVDIHPIAPADYARVAQLTQRTTQFNFSGVRRRELELKKAIELDGVEGIVAKVRDRFGDYGDVGAVLFSDGANELEIDTFVLSCRALGRGVEERIWNHLGQVAKSRGIAWIKATLIPTDRNEPARRFFEGAGVSPQTGDNRLIYRLNTGKPFIAKSVQPPFKPDSVSAKIPRSRINHQRIATELSDLVQIRAAREGGIQKADRSARPGKIRNPENPIQEEIALIWGSSLNRPDPSIDENFFDVGGHSLLAVGLLTRLAQRLLVEISLVAFFEEPTIEALSQKIELALIASLAETESSSTQASFQNQSATSAS